ncbi:MAG: metallophosphoesterase [SAR324 cluster bacterium]|nr:metallophosphoesterase [SAR324 cluster bacterium]
MNIFAISDTHFSLNPNRTMESFGPIWKGHMNQIKKNWRNTVNSSDIVMIGGDISWETKFEKALVHLRELSDLPGSSKIIIKGNHDHWFKSLDDLNGNLPKNMTALMGTAIKIGSHIFAGTRGWLAPNDPAGDSLDKKTFEKEMVLLEQALEQAVALAQKVGAESKIHLLLHFPPFTTTGKTTAFWDLITKYPVHTCTYGHFHLAAEFEAIPKGLVDGIYCNLTSTDYIKHSPVPVFVE